MIDIAVVLNGEMRDREKTAYLLQRAQYIVAVDGGFNHLQNLHCKPDIFFGDGDSLLSENRQKLLDLQIPCQTFPVAKDASDTELALRYLVMRKNSFLPVQGDKLKIALLSAFGARVDHVLANQFLVEKYSADFDFLLTNGRQHQWILANHDKGRNREFRFFDTDFYQYKGADFTFSLLSLSPVTEDVTIHNAEYVLANHCFMHGDSLGISNEPRKQDEQAIKDILIQFGRGCLSIISVPKE